MSAHCVSVFYFTSPDVSMDFFARSVAQVTKSNSPKPMKSIVVDSNNKLIDSN